MSKQYYEWDSKQDKFAEVPRPDKPTFNPIIRLARNADKPLIRQFFRDCCNTEPDVARLPPDFDQVCARIEATDLDDNPDLAMALALVDELMVAEMSMSRYFQDSTFEWVGVIPGLWVLKPYRHAGIAGRLMEFAKQESLRRGFSRIELLVGLDNLAAIEFYKSQGFTINPIGRGILDL
jgi:ribosomal protein S18 acetylase RimI-like enzyme